METLESVGRCAIAAFLLVLFWASSSLQQQFLPHIYTNCLRNATTSVPPTFKSDLDATLQNFSSLSAQGLKYAATSGPALYAMFQCRGDLSTQSCSDCVQNVTAVLPPACPLAVGARVRLDGCFLRYDNQSFFRLDTDWVALLCNVFNTTDLVALTAISDVMLKVIDEAPKRSDRFASAREGDMYGLAECWRYLNESQCSQCLTSYTYRQGCDSKLGGQFHFASCDFRFDNYDFLDSTPSPPPASPPASPSAPPTGSLPPPSLAVPTSSSHSGRKTWIVGVSTVVVFLTVLGSVSGVVWRRRAIKGRDLKAVKNESLQHFETRLFSLEELEEATGHFDDANKLGEGGFGVVYKGTLLSGEKLAIKKLHARSQEGKQEFLNEVNVITNVQHKNLIRLLGCCVEGSERILVYEYLENRSLDFFLSDGEGRNSRNLTWSNRFGIIVGIAKGLGYLHEESQCRIIHRDIKPSNILLDDQLNPVIADFGVARLVQDDRTHFNTRVAGTIGYLAPEYAMHGVLSEKVDVYSFGLVAVEIITGQHILPSTLLRGVWQKYQQGNALNIVDDNLNGNFSHEQALRVVHVALLCTQEDPKQRPRMSVVALWLSGVSDILEIPIRPTILDYNDEAKPTNSNQRVVFASSNSSQGTEQSFPVSGGVQSFSEILDPR